MFIFLVALLLLPCSRFFSILVLYVLSVFSLLLVALLVEVVLLVVLLLLLLLVVVLLVVLVVLLLMLLLARAPFSPLKACAPPPHQAQERGQRIAQRYHEAQLVGGAEEDDAMDTLGLEPSAFHMRSGCDTTTPLCPFPLGLAAKRAASTPQFLMSRHKI